MFDAAAVYPNDHIGERVLRILCPALGEELLIGFQSGHPVAVVFRLCLSRLIVREKLRGLELVPGEQGLDVLCDFALEYPGIHCFSTTFLIWARMLSMRFS